MTKIIETSPFNCYLQNEEDVAHRVTFYIHKVTTIPGRMNRLEDQLIMAQ